MVINDLGEIADYFFRVGKFEEIIALLTDEELEDVKKGVRIELLNYMSN